MPTIMESVEVDVPVRTAYNQWTQFEEFRCLLFMEGNKQVRQLDDTHLHWVAEIGGKREEWDAEITEQHPDHRVAWRATGGKVRTAPRMKKGIDAPGDRISGLGEHYLQYF